MNGLDLLIAGPAIIIFLVLLILDSVAIISCNKFFINLPLLIAIVSIVIFRFLGRFKG